MTPERVLSDGDTGGAALRHLCAQLFLEPSRLVQCAHVPLTPLLTGPLHAHDDLLQLDLALRCGGHWDVDGTAITARDATAVAFYPGQTHGYALRAASPGAYVFSLKLRVEYDWPAIRWRAFPPVLRTAAGQPALVERLRQLGRFAAVSPHVPPTVLASLATVLCGWPVQHAQSTVDRSGAGPVTMADDAVDRAVRLIELRAIDPPSLAELGACAHLSSRQLVRRFQAMLHCTPHEYAAACRVAQARAVLFEGRSNVTEVAAAMGFSTVASFSRWFTRHAGIGPGAFRRDPARPGLNGCKVLPKYR